MTRPNPMNKNQPFYRRLSFAVSGIAAGWKRERSFRVQTLIAAAVLAVLAGLRPGLLWWALAALLIVLVLAAELLNSAFEALVDHLHPEVHPEIRVVKDMAAGFVLLLSVGAVVVGVLLLASAL